MLKLELKKQSEKKLTVQYEGFSNDIQLSTPYVFANDLRLQHFLYDYNFNNIRQWEDTFRYYMELNMADFKENEEKNKW